MEISVSPRPNLTPTFPSGGKGISVVRKETQLQTVPQHYFFRSFFGIERKKKIVPIEGNGRSPQVDVIEGAKTGAKGGVIRVVRENHHGLWCVNNFTVLGGG